MAQNLAGDRSRRYTASRLVLLAALTACPAPRVVVENPTDSTAVVNLIRDFDAAWGRKDTVAVGRALADSYVYFSSNGAVWSRERTTSLLGTPEYRLDTSARGELSVRITDNAAVVGSRWKGTGRYGTEPINDDQRCSLTLARTGDDWRIVSEHCTQISTPP